MLTEHVNPEDKKRMAAESGRIMATDLILRAILLKINSETANEAIRQQITEQMSALRDLWIEDSLLCAQVEGLSGDAYSRFKVELEKDFDLIFKIGKDVVDGIFSKPQDIARLM